MTDLATRSENKELAKRFDALAAKAKKSFAEKFWNSETECLFDVVDGDRADGSVRPNQIFAVSLHYPILEGKKAKAVVEKVERQLLTPKGLRTLSPDDKKYVGRYEGGPFERDSAYHQGTVWAWLIGPFIDAYLRVKGSDRKAAERALKMLTGLEDEIKENMLGTISEIFDGDAPHKARGAAAQAWSVAEFNRVRRMLKELARPETRAA